MKILKFLLLCFFCYSCESTATFFYGIKSIKSLTRDQIKEISISYKIPVDELYFLSANYKLFLDSIEKRYSFVKSSCYTYKPCYNHFQPLQLLFYNKNNKLISFYTNCYVGGFPNLKWDKSGLLNSFPPTTIAPLDSLHDFEDHVKYFIKSDSQKVDLKYFTDFNYKIVVIWTTFMGRQSKRLIRLVNNNFSDKKELKIRILFVNADSIFLK